MSFRKTLYMFSGTLRSLFVLVVILSIAAVNFYVQGLVRDLRKQSRDIAEFYALTYQRLAVAADQPEVLDWLFVNIISRATFPLILTDRDGNPSSWQGLAIPDTARSPEAIRQVRKVLEKMRQENEPIPITYQEYVLSYLYFGDSMLITRLQYLPWVTISGLGLLVLVAFLSFRSIKSSEQRFIWVGMAKETAHQLGTPISSLMGWLELLKSSNHEGPNREQTLTDMEADIKRLEKIAARFSHIGSETLLDPQDLQPILHDVCAYLRKRLPKSGNPIELIENYSELKPVPLNRELFEWAIENLVKNAIDAVKGKRGRIEITTTLLTGKKRVAIDISDNGAGITAKRRNDVFKAGYSTKKRGWGLGLNFAKRIIEEYHHGRLFIKETHIGKGTTMRIII
ncbi:MAG: Sporulation kinase D [bacterium ADurb.Bin431]|nr:MAG: Sporulation kinase D [bacterium ADurb.Bin431]HNY89899.1 HAMP domain-containing sensor histidine kinase [bacterium]HOH05976.1 HAMP domain-containing sensor histidine kinase [bacterium]